MPGAGEAGFAFLNGHWVEGTHSGRDVSKQSVSVKTVLPGSQSEQRGGCVLR